MRCDDDLARLSAAHEGQQPLEQRRGARRAAGNDEIDRNHIRHAPRDGVAAGEDAAVGRAGARGDPPFRRRRGVVGAFQRLTHVPRHRARHQEHVGVPGRGDETEAESLGS